MKLLTHNMLTSRCLKGVVTGYPLGLVAKEIKVQPSDFNKDFIVRVIPKLDWNVFWTTAKQIGYEGNLTEQLIENFESNEDFLRDVHHALVEVDIYEGSLICPETNRKFQINEGIPNMLVKEDEV
ncbi:multifunctional methyltransferase subunit TRM112-like protein [Planococcus citri]|uniref:multifunctional methyltransferase subunit TRM112-like protein n=1 Tax=Planococcus citri TaxID=170843 RepID=UPI0031F80946